MNDPVEGRRIIVTGAAGGIGSGVLKGLSARGARLAAVYNRGEPSEDLRAVAIWRQCDLSDKDQVVRCFSDLSQELGGLDALVNIAGKWQAGPAEEVDEAQIDYLIGANLKSAIFSNQAAFELMKATGGRIINCGSVEGVEGNLISPVYASAKAALHGWTRSAAKSWGQYNITVNCIAPAMWTSVYQNIRDGMTKEQLEWFDAGLAEKIPIKGNLGDAETDCTPLIAFLASEGSGFMTGQLLAVDGGLRMLGA
ncbi:SDR family NAD(P)-dependent oxidoreductase [Rhizorhapis sp. SPR117]|uniref:SDR family NAD(P)-dependent oxidoreductase n=1 Tax=Rhizorhapis sp. SPR117 TaxID=2912611 RepID=UPI001F43DA8A|nr:SDR family oxidoreductase [Rhizorhapis sp. SPR117]